VNRGVSVDEPIMYWTLSRRGPTFTGVNNVDHLVLRKVVCACVFQKCAIELQAAVLYVGSGYYPRSRHSSFLP